MEVSINAKSYAEAYAVVQMVNTSMSMFDGKNYGVKVTINTNNELLAVVSRNKGSSEVSAVIL